MAKYSMKPQIRFKGFTDAWEQRKARDLFNSYADKGYPELPVLSATQDAGMVKRDEIGKSVFHDKSNEVGYKRVLPGQFVIHLRSFQGGFAHSNIEGITSPAYTIFGFKPTEKQYDIFWKYIFSSEEFVRRLETVTYGIRDGRSISYDEFLTMGFIVPSYAEQVKIAHGLIITDNLITLHQCKGNLVQNKYGLHSLFQMQYKLADDWEQRKLGDIGRVAMNRRIFKEQTSAEGSVPFYKIGTFGGEPDAFISDELYQEYKERFPYPKVGDILLSASGSIGKMVEYKGEKAYFQDSNIVWLDHDARVLNVFLKCFYSVVKWAGLEGSTIKRLYNKNILETQIALPSSAEQCLIGDFFEHIDNLITLHQRGKKHIGEIKNDKRNKTE